MGPTVVSRFKRVVGRTPWERPGNAEPQLGVSFPSWAVRSCDTRRAGARRSQGVPGRSQTWPRLFSLDLLRELQIQDTTSTLRADLPCVGKALNMCGIGRGRL